MSLFETATRNKFRYPSPRGELTTEQLWDLPLIDGSRSTRDVKCDLDTVARTINAELKSVSEESFVATAPDPRQTDLQTRLDIVKHVIAVKVKEADEAKRAREKAGERRKLLDMLATKENEALSNLSREEILKRIEALDA